MSGCQEAALGAMHSIRFPTGTWRVGCGALAVLLLVMLIVATVILGKNQGNKDASVSGSDMNTTSTILYLY